MKLSVLFLFFLVWSFDSVAQDDYLVTLKGDTLSGEVTIRSTTYYDEVDLKTEDNRETFKAFQLSIVNWDGEMYRPIDYRNKKTMAQIIIEGNFLSGYRVKPEDSYEYNENVLFRSNGEYEAISAISFRKRARDLVIDCPLVAQKIDDKVLGYNDLIQIIELANARCSSTNADNASAQPEPEVTSQLKDALAVISDVLKKLETGEAIPTYQLDALKKLEEVDLNEELKNLIKRTEKSEN